MKGNELIEKILNREIKSGTLIKMKSNYPNLEWEKTLCFNGNWFSEGKYEIGCPRYDDIILHLCSEYMTFEIIEENKKIEKLNKQHFHKRQRQLANKINEIIDKLNDLESQE